MKKRIVSLVLALSLCTSLLVVPAYADSVISWDTFVKILDTLTIESGMQEFDIGKLGGYVVPSESVWNGNHTTVTYDILENAVFQLQYENPQISFSISPISLHRPSSSTSSTESGYYGVRVIIPYTYAVYWLTNGNGKALVARPASSDITSINSIPRSQAAAAGAYRMLSYEDLYNLAYDYNAQHNYKLALNTDGVYWAISSRGDYVLANESGLPYGSVGPLSITSGGNSRLDAETGEEQLIDWSRGTVINENGDTFDYDGCIFDSSTKTYYIDNHTENYYYTYNYYIEKTYITYIGSSAEYTKTYERYYELPDGRSSADLTKEDLEQLNLSMDVVEYQRSADDTRLRSLYHFDGNTEDSSYWNYATSFDWTSGASLTYLESNAFNGCLYLDELAHDFTITLPSSLGSGDFTVDFRYYQAYTGTPTDDSYISIGGQEVLRLTGSNFTFNGTNYATPVGNWNHLAFVRKDGTLYFYLNGVRQGSKAFSNALSAALQFSFGSDQETYKYLDELRVTNFAVWESNFTPPTVPYDTNLSLVLPTDTVPVADEYWDIRCENNLLSQYNLDWWDAGHSDSGIFSDYFSVLSPNSTRSRPVASFINNSSQPVFSSSSYTHSPSLSSSSFSYPNFYSFSSPSLSSYTKFSDDSIHGFPFRYDEVNYEYVSTGLFTLIHLSKVTGSSTGSLLDLSYRTSLKYLPLSAYTFSMVTPDGEIGSYSFDLNDFNITFPPVGKDRVIFSYSDEFSFNGYLISLSLSAKSSNTGSYHYGYPAVFLSIIPTEDAGEFVYLALEEGTESTVEAEFVSGVAGIPADDLNTPTLAVRSDIAINKKQIGGVRPSFAQRGDVYAMVESGFITSLQQYTGYAWQAVDGRIWTGSRWIPYSSYNVITLSDMYDIADASGQSGYEYIYSQQGFWAWLQKWLMQFKTDLFEKLNGLGSGSSGECKHSYFAEVISDPTCTESGSTRYTCSKCGDIYTEAVSPLGHDYVASEVVEDHYSMPDGAACPECGSSDFTHTLDADTEMYHCVCSDCDEEFDVDAEFEYGYTVYTCTRCDEEYTESNKSKSGLFEAIGDFLADGIQWIGDKLVRLVDAFSGLSDIFRNFAESVKENAGGFPTLFGQVFALIPEDLQTIIWFSLIASIIVAVWKKWFS